MKFLGVTILQGVEFPIFLFTLHKPYNRSATALPVTSEVYYVLSNEPKMNILRCL